MAEVYGVRNKLNGKTYIGFTSRTFSVRRSEHLRTRFRKTTILGRALAKRGGL